MTRKKHSVGIRCAISFSLTVLFVWSANSDGAMAASWGIQRTNTSFSASWNNQVLWTFHFAHDSAKPFFHPVSPPNGPVLTQNAPPDHPWHHGLWFSWKYINKVNYWEENRRTKRAEGLTEWKDVKLRKTEDGVEISLKLTYHPPNQSALLEESRSMKVYLPLAKELYRIDWCSRFKVGDKPIVLDRTPLPGEPHGKFYGGYAGLSVRFTGAMKDIVVTDVNGNISLSSGRYRGRSPAMDYSGRINGQNAGIAILDHPSNPNAPTPWYVICTNRMHYFSPAIICYGPMKLSAGAEFMLRYRIVVHNARWTPEKLRQELKLFTSSRGKTSVPSH